MEAIDRNRRRAVSAAHSFLFAFTILLACKLDHLFSASWWWVFVPLWLFHLVVARGRFSIPAPLDVHYCHRPPPHAFVATQLLVAFELLLCIYLGNSSAVNLKIVFLPVVVLEIIILIDNSRMLFLILLEEARDSSVDNTCEKMTHCLIILSMAFILGATLFMVLMLTGDTATRNWWGPYLVFSAGQSFAFLVCMKWTYPVIDGNSQTRTDYLNQTSCLVAKVEDDQKLGGISSLKNIGRHFMKVLIIGFQVLLCMHLQGTPTIAREIPFLVIFSPLILLEGIGVLFSTLPQVERNFIQRLNIEADNGRYFMFSSGIDFLEFMRHGSRLLGWWSIDEGSRKAKAQLHYNHEPGSYAFCDNPPDVVKKMSKRDLVEEVWTLQVVLNEQIKTTSAIKRKYEKLHKKRVSKVPQDGD